MKELHNTDRYLRAKEKVDAMKGFYWHLFASIFVIVFLSVINYVTTDYPWVLFPIAGILLSILIHWFVVFKSGSFFGKSWEERKIKQFMDEENDGKKWYQ